MRHSVKPSSGAGLLTLAGAPGETHDLLSTLFQSSTVGVGICDRQFRYQAVNDALASINGLPAAAHLGKTLHAVLGKAATKVVPAFQRVFETGKILSNLEVTAKLPLRAEPSHWNESYFPIKDRSGHVLQVGAIVLEVAKGREVGALLHRLTENLTRASAALHDHCSALNPLSSGETCGDADDVFTRSLRLLDTCLSETSAITKLLHDAPGLKCVQTLDVLEADTALPSNGQGQDFVRTGPEECLDPLSAREREVAALLAEGKTNKQIGAMLAISTRTVESHRAKIMLKLDLHSVSDLVRYALRSNLVQP